MNAELQDELRSEPTAWWTRLHQALMPDYNAKTMVYWWVTVLVGAVVLGHALQVLSSSMSLSSDVKSYPHSGQSNNAQSFCSPPSNGSFPSQSQSGQ